VAGSPSTALVPEPFSPASSWLSTLMTLSFGAAAFGFSSSADFFSSGTIPISAAEVYSRSLISESALS
jgi:hypothetical protein